MKPWTIPVIVLAMTIPIVVVAIVRGEVILPLVAWIVLSALVILAGGRFGTDQNVERRRRHGSDP